ncbi:TPA: ash family protein [Klebsiella aerogenes]|nr:ash family protein [Klebsiella aerogenes]HDT5519407.1 ash family protein [Klebsiella aerogenes]
MCTPKAIKAITDAPASFLLSASAHAKIMVGWMGELKGSPGSLISGSANPVQLATSRDLHLSVVIDTTDQGGCFHGYFHLTKSYPICMAFLVLPGKTLSCRCCHV